MSYWDASALVKLYVKKTDSPQFEAMAQAEPPVTGTVGGCTRQGRCFAVAKQRE
jgi:hypothetical protein